MKDILSFNDFKAERLNESVTLSKRSAPRDITKDDKSIAGRVKNLIGEMGQMSYEDLKNAFRNIVTDEEGTNASPETRAKWIQALAKSTGKVSLMQTITNIYLGGAGWKLDRGA
jgi:hypothetical protein